MSKKTERLADHEIDVLRRIIYRHVHGVGHPNEFFGPRQKQLDYDELEAIRQILKERSDRSAAWATTAAAVGAAGFANPAASVAVQGLAETLLKPPPPPTTSDILTHAADALSADQKRLHLDSTRDWKSLISQLYALAATYKNVGL